MTRTIRSTLLAAAAGVWCAAAAAQSDAPAGNIAVSPALCASHQDHVGYLAQEFGEHPVFTGQISEKLMLRIFANAGSGSWTMVILRADGLSCVHQTGDSGRREVGF